MSALGDFDRWEKNGKGAVIMVNVSPDYHTKDKVQQWDFIRAVEKYIAQTEKWD